jgi:hypothetical protein
MTVVRRLLTALAVLVTAFTTMSTSAFGAQSFGFVEGQVVGNGHTLTVGSFTEACPIDTSLPSHPHDCGMNSPALDSFQLTPTLPDPPHAVLSDSCASNQATCTYYVVIDGLISPSREGILDYDEGSYSGSFTWEDPARGVPPTDVSLTATVSDGLLSDASGFVQYQGQEGQAAPSSNTCPLCPSDTVGNFGDPGWPVNGSFAATIDWGDGSSPTQGTVFGADGLVTGTHVYSHAGTFHPSVLLIDDGGSTVTLHPTLVITDAPLTASGSSVSATEDAQFAAGVASFTDANPFAVSSDFTATIDWGDGTSTSSGSVVGNATSGFTVVGSHTYTKPGSDPVKVMINDSGGASATATGTASVADAPLTATGSSLSGTEGSSLSGTVARFTDANPHGALGDFAAKIDWGDGSTGPGAISANAGGGFRVSGSHTYVTSGSRPIRVTILDSAGPSTTATSTATVSDAPLTLAGIPVTGAESATFSGTVATLTDPNPYAAAADFTATINWGDRTTSAGSVIATGGKFKITGDHTYDEGGRPSVTVTVKDSGGATKSVNTVAAITDLPLSGSGVTRVTTAGAAFSGVVARFADADQQTTASDFEAAIDWGDGSTGTGTVRALGGGDFAVSGTHVYHDLQTADVVIRVTDSGGARTILSSTIFVNGPGKPAFTNLLIPGSQRGTGVSGALTVKTPNSTLTVVLTVPGNEATAGGKPVVVGTLAVGPVRSGTHDFSVRLNARGAQALHHHHTLDITLRLTLKPPKGKGTTALRLVTLRL